MLKYQLNLMKKGGNKKGFLKSDRKLSEPAINELKRAWTKLNSNENSDNVVVLNQGLEFQESSNNAAQMQLNQSITTLNQEIDKIFHFSDDYEKFIKNAVQPICTAFETALNRDLLLEREKDDYFFAFDYSEVLRANMKERFESYKLAKEAGWITKNEIREMEHLKTYKGLDIIDVGLGSTNYNPVKDEWFVPNTGQMTNSDNNTSSSNSSSKGDDGDTKGGE
jgi:HK97 family phage portal protein